MSGFIQDKKYYTKYMNTTMNIILPKYLDKYF